MDSMNKVLITGNAGFIFSHVTDYFLDLGWSVVGVDNLSAGSHPELIPEWENNPNFKFYEEHVGNKEFLDIVEKEQPDYIIHAGAMSDVDFSIKFPRETLDANIAGNINVFEAARKLPNLKKLLYVSTDEVYGECEYLKKEEDIIFPKNPYACSKAVGSLMRLTYDNSYPELKGKTCETRFCNVFGERQDSRKILPAIKESLMNGTSIPLHNGGEGYREYIYVLNIPPIVHKILEDGWRTYNITLNEGFTVRELIKKAEEVTGQTVTTHDSHREGMDSKYQMDSTRVRELGWKPLYSFEEGLINYLKS